MIGKRTIPSRHDEQGSVVLAVIIVGVLGLLAAAVVTTSVSSLNLSRNDQNRNNAFQFANAGIDQAVYRIDARNLPMTPSGNYVPTVNGGVVTGFSDTYIVGASTFTVLATATPPGQTTTWTVRSTGTDPSGKKRYAISTVVATPVFQYFFFTDTLFRLTGLQTTPLAYRSSICPDPRINPAAAGCNLPTPIDGRLGTNGIIDLGSTATQTAFISAWGGFDMWGHSTQASADHDCASGACGTYPKVQAISLGFPYRYPTPGGSCPSGGIFTGNISAGDYNCANVSFVGRVNVTGSGNVRVWASGTISGTVGTVVNAGQRPDRFQIYQTVPGGSGSRLRVAADSSSICDAQFWSLLSAPRLNIACTGAHQPTIYGAVVAHGYTGSGNQFDFHWDADARTAVDDGRYVVKSWRECPPGASDC